MKLIKTFASVALAAVIAVSVCTVPASAKSVGGAPVMLSAEGFSTRFALAGGSSLTLGGVPDVDSLTAAYGNYSVLHGGKEVMNVSGAGASGSEVGADDEGFQYSSVEFMINYTRNCYMTGLKSNNIKILQNKILEFYRYGEPITMEHTGFIDAEKTKAEDGDDDLCWAAMASNMLTYAGWAPSNKPAYTDTLFDGFVDDFENGGMLSDTGLCWYINGVLGSNHTFFEQEGAAKPKNDGLNRFPDYPHDMQIETGEFGVKPAAENMKKITRALRDGCAVGLGLAITKGTNRNYYLGGHAVTCMGYVENITLSEDDPARYEAIIIADSDSYMTDNRSDAPNQYSSYRLDLRNSFIGYTYELKGLIHAMASMVADYVILKPFSQAVIETDPDATRDKKNTCDLCAWKLIAENRDAPLSEQLRVGAEADIWLNPLIANSGDIAFEGDVTYDLTITNGSGALVHQSRNTAKYKLDDYIGDIGDKSVYIGALPEGEYTVELKINPEKKLREAYYVNNSMSCKLRVDSYSFDISSLGFEARLDRSEPAKPKAVFEYSGADRLSGEITEVSLYAGRRSPDGSTDWTEIKFTPAENGLPAYSENLPEKGEGLLQFCLGFKCGDDPTAWVYSVVYNDGRSTRGDINLDGAINIDDATLTQKYTARLIGLDTGAKQNADANRDGKIDINDATCIQKHTAKLIVIE